MMMKMRPRCSYSANGCLHDRVEAALRHVDVGGDTLPRDDLVELVGVARQREDVLVAEGGKAVDVHAPERQREHTHTHTPNTHPTHTQHTQHTDTVKPGNGKHQTLKSTFVEGDNISLWYIKSIFSSIHSCKVNRTSIIIAREPA